MSLGYAEKLSLKEDVGAVGMPEIYDPLVTLHQKVERLAAMIMQSKHVIAFTGAGISTSCGLPDFRGPKGIWTLQRQGKGVPQASLPYDRAVPGITHMALAKLVEVGILKFVITQNVDGLHIRSGIPRDKLAELHGNSFRETCPSCGKELIRDFEVETIGLKKTPRRCSGDNCKERLRDSVIDWENEVPSKEIFMAEKHCQVADLVLCLGSSLQLTPACDIPLKALQAGGKVVIVNLQQTPKDKDASLVIHGLVDKVISGVMHCLNFPIPPFVHIDLFQIVLTRFLRLSDKRYMKWTLRVSSIHGSRAPLPYIRTVEVSFPGRPELKTATLSKQPFILKREMIKARPFTIMLKLNFSEGCGTHYANVEYPVDFQATMDDVDYGKEKVVQMLKDTAIQDQCCGQISLVERKALPSPKGEAAIYAIATNLTWNGNGNGNGHGHGFPLGMALPAPAAAPAPPAVASIQLQSPPQPSLPPPFAVHMPMIPPHFGANGNFNSNNSGGLKRKLPDSSSGPEMVPQSKSMKDFRQCETPFWFQNFLLSHHSPKQ